MCSHDGERLKLHNKILLGLGLGAVCGVAANAFAADAGWVLWLADNVAYPVGQVFLRMLLMTVIPLVFASIVLGVAGLGDLTKLGRVGGRALGYFLVSTVISAVLGLTLVNVFQPGAGIDPVLRQQLFETFRGQAEGVQAEVARVAA